MKSSYNYERITDLQTVNKELFECAKRITKAEDIIDHRIGSAPNVALKLQSIKLSISSAQHDVNMEIERYQRWENEDKLTAEQHRAAENAAVIKHAQTLKDLGGAVL